MRRLINGGKVILILLACFVITSGCAAPQSTSNQGLSQSVPAERQGQNPSAEPQKEDPAVLEKIEKGEIVEEDLQTFLTPKERYPELSPAICRA